MKFFLIHGVCGNPEKNWFPWLKNELEKLGHEVIVPAFPTPEGQSLDSWMKVFDEYIDKVDSETIFIGHSLGAPFILSILEKINIKVKACFFAAGFIGLMGFPLDEVNKTLTDKKFNWDKIKENCNNFYMFHSDTDPFIPMKVAKSLASNLGTSVIEVKDAGHFNEDAGYTEFPLLLEKIKEII